MFLKLDEVVNNKKINEEDWIRKKKMNSLLLPSTPTYKSGKKEANPKAYITSKSLDESDISDH